MVQAVVGVQPGGSQLPFKHVQPTPGWIVVQLLLSGAGGGGGGGVGIPEDPGGSQLPFTQTQVAPG